MLEIGESYCPCMRKNYVTYHYTQINHPLYIKSTYKRMCHAKGDNDSTVVCDQILIKKEEEEDY